MIVPLGRVHKMGRSKAVLIPKELFDTLTWKVGDRIAIRTAGEKLILERVPMENFARIRTGEAGATA